MADNLTIFMGQIETGVLNSLEPRPVQGLPPLYLNGIIRRVSVKYLKYCSTPVFEYVTRNKRFGIHVIFCIHA